MDDQTPQTNTPAPGDQTPSTVTTNDDRLALLKSRTSLAKSFCKKAHTSWKTWMKEYNIDDFNDSSEVRDKVRIGYLFRKAESELPAIFDDQPEIFIKGRSSATKDVEPLITGLYDYLWDIQDLEEKIEDAGLYFEVLGMGYISSPWVTKTKQVPQQVQQPVVDPQTQQPVLDPTTGQPQMQMVTQMMDVPVIDNPLAEVEDPFKIFFSPETKFAPVLTPDKCPYYIKQTLMTEDEIFSKFGVHVQASETLKIDDPDVDSTVKDNAQIVKDDLKRATVYEYYGILPEDMVADIKDSQGEATKWEYDKDYHLFFTMNEELKVEECPYENKPLYILGNYGMANRFFKFGDAKHLMPLISEYQQYRTQLLNHLKRTANPKALINADATVDEDAFRNPRAGNIVKWSGQVAPAYLAPPGLSRDHGEAMQVVQQDLEKTSGSFDLANGGAQSTVKTPRGIEVYAAAADKNIARKRKKVARFIRQLLIFQFQQVAQYWKPEDNKVLSIIDGDNPQPIQVTQEVLQVIGGINSMYYLDIEPESLSLNRALMKQDALDLFTLAAEHPDIFNIDECAKDLLESGYQKKDADRFLLNDQQKQAMAQSKAPQPNVSVSIKADAATPQGMQLLENEQLIQPGQAQQMMQTQQAIAQVAQQPMLPGQPQGQGMPQLSSQGPQQLPPPQAMQSMQQGGIGA